MEGDFAVMYHATHDVMQHGVPDYAKEAGGGPKSGYTVL